jgi:hypothetical protein
LISRQKNKLRSAGKPISLALFLCACGASQNGSGTDGICALTLKPASENSAGTDLKQIIYSGTMPEACLKKTTESTGRALVKLAAQAPSPSELVALDTLKAGARTLKFDASTDNFKRGTFEKSFDSTLLPEWALPWSDRPTAITLSMQAPTAASAGAVPGSISVELRF